MRSVNFTQRILIATWMATALVALADGALAEDLSKRYGSLAELFAADAYIKAEQVPFERVSGSVVDCRFFPGRKRRRIKVTFASQVYRGKRCPHEAIMCLPTQHTDAWRFAVAAALLGRPVPTVKIEARPDGDGFEVFATVSNVGRVKRLVIHSTSDPTGDYRRAKWRTKEIAIPEDLSRPFRIARVQRPESGTRAAYLELIDHHELCDSIVHSNVIEIGQAVKHEMAE